MNQKDLKLLKETVAYNPVTGEFFRGCHSMRPLSLNFSKRNACVSVWADDYRKSHQAWRAAIYLAQGWYPADEDCVFYEDGNERNLKITNLKVVFPRSDQMTILEFSTEHGLSPQTVNTKMRNSIRYPRNVRNFRVNYYDLDELNFRCRKLLAKVKKNLDDEDNEFIKKRTKISAEDITRPNKLIRAFLAHWTTPKPTKWELTLC
jgi:hypothetical protein